MEVHQQQQCPEDFRCPISLEVMSDPVILTSGHTFDRASIQRWLDSGNRTCPVTKLPLPLHPPLIPNHALRSLISNFAPPSPPPTDGTLAAAVAAAAGAVPALSFPSDCHSLAAVRRLARSDPALRRLIAESGATAILLRHVASSDLPELQETALRLVLDLSLDGDDVKVGLVADGAVDAVVAALRSAVAPACRAAAATALTSLAVADVNKCTIGAHPLAIPGLVNLLAAGRTPRERREAATALYALCSFPANRPRAAHCGAVPPLAELARSGLDRAAEALALIAKCAEGRDSIITVDNFIQSMADVIRGGRARGIEHAVAVLKLLCRDSSKARAEARAEGVFELALGLIADGGKIAKHAGELVKVLQIA